ncbi:MAG: transglycosylase domain-containing protein [Thermomicrobiales bacterium]
MASGYSAAEVRRRRALRRLSGRNAAKLPPQVLRALNSRTRKGQTGRSNRRLMAAGGFGTVIASLSGSTLAIALLGVTLVVGTAIAGYAYFAQNLPDVHEFEAQPFGTTRIYDRNGRLLHEVSDPDLGWRTNIRLDQVSDWAVKATLAAEDPTFYSNPGVDPTAILRAALINYNGEGSSGGSTITQQLVRALYPNSIGTELSITRKAREAIVAVRFSRAYEKDEVLNLYLNEIYYGNRSYGIEAASESYFNKHASELDLAEASMLAGLPQLPSFYDPRYNFEAAKLRQQYVLEQMIRNGLVTRAEAEAAFATPLLPQTREGRYNDAPHFVNFVRDYIERKYGADKLFRGDLQITTTLDYEAQIAGERIVRQQVQKLRAQNATNGALVAILPATGEILAMVGSADFYDDSIDGQVNITVRERQPGSSIKPIAYAATFQKGWSPATRIMDVKAVYPVTSRAYGELEALRAQGRDPDPGRLADTSSFYVPENFDFTYHGAVTVREAMARSLNIPAVKAIQFATIDSVIDLAHKMGHKTGLWRGAGYYGYTLALGGGEVLPLEHTNAYATFANGGRYVPYTPILKIVDGTTGRVIEELDRKGALAKGQQVLAPENAYQITSIATDNEARAPDYGLNSPLVVPELGRPAAAKTGTTNDNRDIWTMGYTTDLAVGVWVGNSNNAKTNGVLGASGAAPIWHNFMVEAHQRPEIARDLLDPNGQPYPKEFPVPPTVVEADVCPGTGKKLGGGARPTTNRSVAGTPIVVSAGPRGGKDWFPVNQADARCDVMTPEENDELNIALRSITRDAGKYAPGAIESVLAYRAAVSNFQPAGGVDPLSPPTPTPTAVQTKSLTPSPGQTPSPGPSPTAPPGQPPTRTPAGAGPTPTPPKNNPSPTPTRGR